MASFKLVSEFAPTGDQPEAIEKIVAGLNAGERMQTLLGVTGSGKTFTMANVIARMNRPTLILAHNKTLAAQLCSEFREFFPENAVEYFVSYYDYYQPEAYIPGKDMYIEKDAMVNDEIDRLRHSATSALFERRDVIIVAMLVVVSDNKVAGQSHRLLAAPFGTSLIGMLEQKPYGLRPQCFLQGSIAHLPDDVRVVLQLLPSASQRTGHLCVLYQFMDTEHLEERWFRDEPSLQNIRVPLLHPTSSLFPSRKKRAS